MNNIRWRVAGNGAEFLLERERFDGGTDLFGAVEPNADGTFTAGVPIPYNEDEDSDWEDVGDGFKALEHAKQAVWLANNPLVNGVYC